MLCAYRVGARLQRRVNDEPSWLRVTRATRSSGRPFRSAVSPISPPFDELVKQTGQPAENWLLVIVKELVDNALDEAEKAGVAPAVEIVVAATPSPSPIMAGASHPP